MSSWRLVAALLLVAGRSAAAQGSSPLAEEIARLERRVDSMRVEQRHATALVAAAGTVVAPARSVATLDLIRVGGFQIRANRSPLPVTAAAEEAWRQLGGYFGDELAQLPLRPILVEGTHPDSNGGSLEEKADLVIRWDQSVGSLVAQLIGAAGPDPLDADLEQWLGGRPRPGSGTVAALAKARDQLVLAPFSTGHDCVAGDLIACRGALRLGPADGWAAQSFPEPGDRRQVALLVGRTRSGALAAGVERCLGARDDESCSAVVRAVDISALPSVADQATRRTLLDAALRRGGAGAYHRLRATPSPAMEVRLAAAAGVPIDTLLADWRVEMVQAVRTVTPWSTKIGVAGIGWLVVFLACALWSSRWRAD